MKYILLALFSFPAYSSTVGYFTGTHLVNKELSNSHPFIEINDTVLLYRNSFEKTSVAAYASLGSDCFKLRVGLTTGYKRNMQYKGWNYQTVVITDNLSPFIVPSFELKYDNTRGIIGIMGDSINIGLGIDF